MSIKAILFDLDGTLLPMDQDVFVQSYFKLLATRMAPFGYEPGKLGLQPKECVMVGNDATEDLAAAELGIPVFLLTDCLINKSGKDISQYPNGGFDALDAYLAAL